MDQKKNKLIDKEYDIPTFEQVRAERAKRSLYIFVKEFWNEIEPEDFKDNWHIKYLCDEIQKVAERVFKRLPKKYDLVINIPPGTTKSTICTIMAPAWFWANDPTIRTISTSYSGNFALKHSVRSRDIIRSDKYKQYYGNIQIKQDEDTKGYYKNEQGGDRLAVGVGGSLPGMHGHFIIPDDPINPFKADSEVIRETANNYIRKVLPTRKVDKEITVTIMIMQRVHYQDPTAVFLENFNAKHICLPGEDSFDIYPNELAKNYKNGLLDPKRLKRITLEDLQKELGEYGYTSQIGQAPVREGGVIWKEWFIPVKDEDFPELRTMDNLGTDWDTAYTEKEENSASAYITSGKYRGKMYIIDLGWAWLEFPELIKLMKSLRKPHYIEAKASGKSATQTLRKNSIPAIEVEIPGGNDKIARARLAAPYAEGGLVYVRESLIEKLYFDKKQGILKFPKGINTDLSDVLAQAIQRHFGKPEVITKSLKSVGVYMP